MKIGQISSKLLFFPIILCFMLISCQEPLGTATENGCIDDLDCPLPDRQRCIPELGICVGHTSKPGNTDASVEDIDSDL